MDQVKVAFTLNGDQVDLRAPADRTLLRALRDDLGLTGTKEGCAEGECGACTVLLDGEPVCSCLVLAAQVAGREVTTIEGLGQPDGTLDPMQEAFIDGGAVQCGFCTPGMILTAKGAVRAGASPDEVRTALAGNLCRCTGYTKIVDAVSRCHHQVEGAEGGGAIAASTPAAARGAGPGAAAE